MLAPCASGGGAIPAPEGVASPCGRFVAASTALRLALAAVVALLGGLALGGCTMGAARRTACLDPTKDGACFCPAGASCAHVCEPAVSHCLLGCSQGNPSCSVRCGNDCVALCSGAGECDTRCEDRCNVSCENTTQICTAEVGANSHVRCEGAHDCRVSCRGSCTVDCPRGRCRVRCAKQEDCDLDCGPSAAASGGGLTSCPDGTRVCGQPC